MTAPENMGGLGSFTPQQVSLPVIPTPSGSALATLVPAGPPAPPILTGMRQSWLVKVHPEYASNVDRWVYTLEHYQGSVLDPDKVIKYLPRKQQAESIEGYRERTAMADYTPHFATVVDSLAGMLFSTEADTTRDWGELGDENDPTSTAGRLKINADGRGSQWVTIWKQCTVDLLTVHRIWILVDADDEGNSRIITLPVTAVRNWRLEEGRLVECVVAEVSDQRPNLQSDHGVLDSFATQYVHYRLDGWTRYALDRNQRERKLSEGFYHFEDRYGDPMLPIYNVELPLRRNVGWMLARKANAMFNKESERDHLLRSCALSIKLILKGDDILIEKLKSLLIETGSNVLQEDPEGGGGHRYIAPESGPVTVANATQSERRQDFYKVAFREYSDTARQRTATEVRQEIAAGSGAILQLVKSTLDEAENEADWRLEQIEFPTQKQKWWKANCERTEDFSPSDPNEILDKYEKRYFGAEGIPVGRAALRSAVEEAVSYDGLDEADDEAELTVAVDAFLVRRNLQAVEQMPLGAEARAAMANALAKQAVGLEAWNSKVDTGALDPTTGKPFTGTLGELVEQENLAVARAQMQAEVRGSQYSPGQQTVGGGLEAEGAKPGGAGAPGGGAPPSPPPGGAPPPPPAKPGRVVPPKGTVRQPPR